MHVVLAEHHLHHPGLLHETVTVRFASLRRELAEVRYRIHHGAGMLIALQPSEGIRRER